MIVNSPHVLVPAVCNARSDAQRIKLASLVVAAIAVGYAALSLFYFHVDFFKYLHAGTPVRVDGAGVAVPVPGEPHLWTVLSPWRVLLAGVAIALLFASARRLWNGHPRGRALALLTLWGVLLPQVLWYTELLVDWYGGEGLFGTVLFSLMVVSVPTLLLIDLDTLGGWGPSHGPRGRLFATAIALGWVAMLAVECLDHSYQLRSQQAYAGALLAAGLSLVAMLGMFRLRAWALWLGVIAAASLALVPLEFRWSSYFMTGGYIDAFVAATMGTPARAALSALLPLAAISWLAAPYLRAFLHRLARPL